jgi:hypothetical protein
MAAPSRNSVEAKPAISGKIASVRLANGQDQAAPSAALNWREALPERWLDATLRAEAPAKWSSRRTLAFVGLSCGGFWVCVALGVSRLAH